MIEISVVKESNYPVKSSNIKKALSNYLKEKKAGEKIEILVSVVSLETMKSLGKRYHLKKRSW